MGYQDKGFDQKSHDINDTIGRIVLAKYFRNKLNIILEHNPDKYGIDLRGEINDTIFYFDVEVRNDIFRKDGGFRYSSIHVPARKRKFADYPNGYFVSIDSSLKYLVFIPAKAVRDRKPKEIQNKKSDSGSGLFFDVPIEECKIRKIPKHDTLIVDLVKLPMNQLCNSGLTLDQVNKL